METSRIFLIPTYVCVNSFFSSALSLAESDQVPMDADAKFAIKEYVNLYSAGAQSGGGFNLSAMLAVFLFGGIGFIAFCYGKKISSWKPMALGILLMVYPYFVSNALATYAIGAGLCAALYFFRD